MDDLYREQILEHYKRPHNWGPMEDPDRVAEDYNPLCGDELKVMLRVDDDGRAALFVTGEPVRRRINRRQDMPAAWVMNGAVYLFRTGVLFAAEPSLYGNSTLAMRMPEAFGISIDTLADWAHAEDAMGHHHGS